MALVNGCLDWADEQLVSDSGLIPIHPIHSKTRYLTNNHLTALPSSMGRLQKLRKLQASFNRLRTLPEGMRHMEALELFRAACNPELEDVPPYLGTLVDACDQFLGGW